MKNNTSDIHSEQFNSKWVSVARGGITAARAVDWKATCIADTGLIPHFNRDFFPLSLQCRLAYGVQTAPVCIHPDVTAMVDGVKHQVANPVWSRMHQHLWAQ